MEGEQKPIIVVDESRFDFLLNLVGLAAKLRAVVGDLHRLALFVLPLESDLAGLRLPLPAVGEFEDPGDFPSPGITDRLDLIPRIDTVSLRNVFENWRAVLRPRGGGQEKHCKSQKTNPGHTVGDYLLVWHGFAP